MSIEARRVEAALRIASVCFGAFAVLGGLADVLAGPALLVASGARLDGAASDPLLASQIRFLGGIWAGWGAGMILAARDPVGRGGHLALFGATLTLGGVGRAIALATTTAPPPILILFTAIEIVGPAAVACLRTTVIRTRR